MSKTVTGYIEIKGVSYTEMFKNPHLVLEAFELVKEVLPLDVTVEVGTATFYDKTTVQGIIIRNKKNPKFNQIVITEKGLLYDDMIDKSFFQNVRQVLSEIVPANFQVDKELKKIKNIKKVNKKIKDTKIVVEVEL